MRWSSTLTLTPAVPVIEEAASKLATTPDTPPMIKVLVELRRQVRPANRELVT